MLTECSITPTSGDLNNIVAQFGNIATHWQSTINPLTQKIFFLLFGIEFMWQLTVNKVFAGDVERIWVFFFVRSTVCFFFARYIININTYASIMNYFVNLGGALSGIAFSLTPGNNFTTIGPSQIMDSFSCASNAIHQITDSTGSLDYITMKIMLSVMGVMLFVTLAYIAFMLIKIMLKTYFLLYVGFILTGFAGSSWTMPYFQQYMRAFSGTILEFMGMSFVVGIFYNQLTLWLNNIAQAGVIHFIATGIGDFVGGSIVFALLMRSIIEWTGTLGSHINLKFANSYINLSGRIAGNR